MTESDIQTILMSYAIRGKNHHAAVPNVTMVYQWEADLLSVTKSWLVHEYEIKLSKSDFMADKRKKEKHEKLLHRFENGNKPRPPRNKREQYLFDIGLTGFTQPKTPNYFWYVTFGFELSLVDIPDYAGWLIVEHNKQNRLITNLQKNAPRLHTRKMSDDDKFGIGRWLAFKLLNLMERTNE